MKLNAGTYARSGVILSLLVVCYTIGLHLTDTQTQQANVVCLPACLSACLPLLLATIDSEGNERLARSTNTLHQRSKNNAEKSTNSAVISSEIWRISR